MEAGKTASDRRVQTTTLSGWRKFVDTAPASVHLCPDGAFLSSASRKAYDQARIAYHSESVIVETSALREVTRQGQLLALKNRCEIGARRGLIVSGPPGTGKSTALKQLGRSHELMTRERDPEPDRIPVVYIAAPPKASLRRLALELATFLGLSPIRATWNTADIVHAVCEALIEARCDLVLVDEIHNLKPPGTGGDDIPSQLTYFAEHLPATFVCAGVNVERTGLFNGVRGEHVPDRYAVTSTGPFHQQEWERLVAAMESALRLHRHQPGALPAIERYLHQRTGGLIGSLSHLIRTGAILAIRDGSEAISQDLLDSIPIDHAA